jgi:hypothetical protein
MLAAKVEDMLNTVVRQIAFYSFERKLHTERRNGELTAEQICELWMSVQGESLGPAIRLGPGYETFWAYIPHFVHSPFYVYAYAFGDCLVNSLYGVYQNAQTGFVEQVFRAAVGRRHEAPFRTAGALRARRPRSGILADRAGMIEGMIDELEHRKAAGRDRSGRCAHRATGARTLHRPQGDAGNLRKRRETVRPGRPRRSRRPDGQLRLDGGAAVRLRHATGRRHDRFAACRLTIPDLALLDAAAAPCYTLCITWFPPGGAKRWMTGHERKFEDRKQHPRPADPQAVHLSVYDPKFTSAMEYARKGMKKYRNALAELAK